jgi:hypothetical protein
MKHKLWMKIIALMVMTISVHLLPAISANPASLRCLREGAVCVTIAGPVGECCPGLSCKFIAPDLSVCK